jgi:hypothetical protein
VEKQPESGQNAILDPEIRLFGDFTPIRIEAECSRHHIDSSGSGIQPAA